jgi:hypothetical protein
MADGEHMSAILEMPNGELRTQRFSTAEQGLQTSSLLAWQLDEKLDRFSKASADDAVAQMKTRLAHPQTLQAGDVLPVFFVTNADGTLITGSIEYHVHLPQPVSGLAHPIADNR